MTIPDQQSILDIFHASILFQNLKDKILLLITPQISKTINTLLSNEDPQIQSQLIKSLPENTIKNTLYDRIKHMKVYTDQVFELTKERMMEDENRVVMMDAFQRISRGSEDGDLMPFVHVKDELGGKNGGKRQRQESVQVFGIGMLVAAYITGKEEIDEVVVGERVVIKTVEDGMIVDKTDDVRVDTINIDQEDTTDSAATNEQTTHSTTLDTTMHDTEELANVSNVAIIHTQSTDTEPIDLKQTKPITEQQTTPISTTQVIIVKIKSYSPQTQLYTVVDTEEESPEEIQLYSSQLRDFGRFEEYKQGTRVMALYETDPAVYSTEFYEATVIKRNKQYVRIQYVDGELGRILATQMFETK